MQAAKNVDKENLGSMSDEKIVQLLMDKVIPSHRLEQELNDATRAVAIRRQYVASCIEKQSGIKNATENMKNLPMASFNEDFFYKSIENTNCEQVIGYTPIPVGVVGPLVVNNQTFYVPMATTEGALIASTCRGARAIKEAGGCDSVLTADGMTRAPLLQMPSMKAATDLKKWVEVPENYQRLVDAFNSTTRYGRVKEITLTNAGRNVYMRFKCVTGDAMGMNMITKGVQEALTLLSEEFPDMKPLSLSGNMCSDKKPSAMNWIQGRGKSISAEVHLSEDILKRVLKTDAESVVQLNHSKNLVGSAMAGSIGGFNAHASNIVTAVFLATGQDPAQNVESSNCITLFEKDEEGTGVYASVTMPSIEVGTVGGGTSLAAQQAALDMMGLRGASKAEPGSNAQQLARVIASTVLAGELSLMAALSSGDLLNAHIKLNRKRTSPAPSDEGLHANGHTQKVKAAPSVHPHNGPGGGVGPFKVPEASSSPGRRYFAAPSAAKEEAWHPRLCVP